jgi:TonB family protein
MDAETHVGHRPLARGYLGGVLLTVLIHGLIVVAIYESQRRSAPRPEAVRDFIVTRTVSFAKKREKFHLPRIVSPPPPQAPPVLKLTQNPEAPAVPPPPKEAPRLEDPKLSNPLRRALERARSLANATREEPEEGSATGSLEGTSSQAAAGDAYWTEVHNAIHQNWSSPTGLLNDAQLAALSAEVRVQIDSDGTLREAALSRPSGNAIYDESCMNAVRTTGRVPPPPLAMRAKARRGVALVFEGKDLGR